MKCNTFLQYVAKDILAKSGGDLSRTAVVFPNKRASLFLNQAFIDCTSKPIWSPAYITISDLFRHHSPLKVPEQMELIFMLYDTYIQTTMEAESLDHFYGWGQLMLADFDDIDKNMADADKVYSNLEDLEDLKDNSYLTEEQKESLRQFFGRDLNSALTDEFKKFWGYQKDIYHNFRKRLMNHGLAYEGMLYRQVAEDEQLDFVYDHYIFVGFNLLQKVEQKLFTRLKDLGMANFYWDYDESYIHEEAGSYISSYLDKFPNELSSKRLSHELLTSDLTTTEAVEREIYDRMKRPKSITYYSASTETVQAAFVTHWIQERNRAKDGRRTAIVLSDERLLQQVIHALPDSNLKVNITTGYPLSVCQISSFVNDLLELQMRGRVSASQFRLKYVLHVLFHPLAKFFSGDCQSLAVSLKEQFNYYPKISQLTDGSPALSLLFEMRYEGHQLSLVGWLAQIVRMVGLGAAEESDPLLQESVFRMFTLLNRLDSLVSITGFDDSLKQENIVDASNAKEMQEQAMASTSQSTKREVSLIILRKLMSQLIQSTSVPFHGEPAVGIQIMGVLETRNLDFDHVLLLSCNEGNLPKGINDTSLIPHLIRKAYGLTTVENKVAIYSYYFHSLLQRASDVAITYNNATDDGKSGEMSRFMLQQLVIRSDIQRKSLLAEQDVEMTVHPTIEKSSEVMSGLGKVTYLSPTAINRYLRCPLQFYFYSVLGLKEDEDEEEETLDGRTFGDIFHKAAFNVYQRLSDNCRRQVTRESIEQVRNSEDIIYNFIDQAFTEILFKNNSGHPGYNGLQLINRKVIREYLVQLLKIDSQRAPFEILGLEQQTSGKVAFNTEQGKQMELTIGGTIDRIDRKVDNGQEVVRIVDYKTGSPLSSLPHDVDMIFSSDMVDSRHTSYYLQTFLYSFLWYDEAMKGINSPVRLTGQEKLQPALFFVRQASGKNYDPVLRFGTGKKQEDGRIDDVMNFRKEFYSRLQNLLAEIFNPGIPFKPTEDMRRCENCPYKAICR